MKKSFSIVLLLLVVFISLALSTLPVFSNINETISEGFASPKEIKAIQVLIDKFNTNIENACKKAVTGPGSNLKTIAWSTDNSPTAKEIFAQSGITYTNMVNQIMEKIKPPDPASQKILSGISGQMFSETQAVLNGIVAMNITDDEALMAIVNQNVSVPIIMSKGAAVASVTQISNYLNGSSTD